MVIHARSGGNIEVMGLLLGKVEGQTMIVMDSFALPVEGTETRVNAHVQAYEYMVIYTAMAKQVSRLENVVGWYHSHPGYGCWLSGIDVSTQMLNQQFQEPWVAIVVDPTRTISSGKVNLGAFRTYPKVTFISILIIFKDLFFILYLLKFYRIISQLKKDHPNIKVFH